MSLLHPHSWKNDFALYKIQGWQLFSLQTSDIFFQYFLDKYSTIFSTNVLLDNLCLLSLLISKIFFAFSALKFHSNVSWCAFSFICPTWDSSQIPANSPWPAALMFRPCPSFATVRPVKHSHSVSTMVITFLPFVYHQGPLCVFNLHCKCISPSLSSLWSWATPDEKMFFSGHLMFA